MLKGQYIEELKCGGKLKVSHSDWEIDFFFLGPDLRYKGSRYIVKSNEIESFINALRMRFERYTELKSKFDEDGEEVKEYDPLFSIYITKYFNGVGLDIGKLFSTEFEMNEFISEIEGCKVIAEKSMYFMSLMSNDTDTKSKSSVFGLELLASASKDAKELLNKIDNLSLHLNTRY